MIVSRTNCSYLFASIVSYPVFMAFSGGLLAGYLAYFGRRFLKAKNKKGLAGVFLITLGGLANMFERFANDGCVSDYFNFFDLYAFNLYDLLIDIGLVLTVLAYFFPTSHQGEAPPLANDNQNS